MEIEHDKNAPENKKPVAKIAIGNSEKSFR
jgi:hypothetical protein